MLFLSLCRNFSLDNRIEKKGHGYIRKEVQLGCCIFSSSGSYSSKGHLKVRRHFLQCTEKMNRYIIFQDFFELHCAFINMNICECTVHVQFTCTVLNLM